MHCVLPVEALAHDLFQACGGNPAALDRLNTLFGASFTAEQLRSQLEQRLTAITGSPGQPITLANAQLVLARMYGFESWPRLLQSASQPPADPRTYPHGLNPSPPFFRIDWRGNSIEPRPPVTEAGWDVIFSVMQEAGITNLKAAGQMTDESLRRLTRLGFVTSLDLEGCRRVTDDGLRHLVDMPQLRSLNLTHCAITGRGLDVLAQLPELREFSLCHHNGVSDSALAHLARCEHIERVNLLGSNSGDGMIRALAGKMKLRHFKSGNHVTDDGVALLDQLPVFKTWQGGDVRVELMAFEAEPNLLLLRGPITGKGMAHLAGLDGLFALNMDDSKLAVTAAGLQRIAELPRLAWLGFDAKDDTMPVIAAMPHLRMLMCQDTSAGDDGFAALSRSRTLEYIWGRRCHNLQNRGFRALATMPSLRGLSISCKNVDDAALSALPHFPALREFMPMDVPDEGFRHVGRCEKLEALWCMYCRDTGDAATAYITSLSTLRTYYAGQTRITDHSLQLLSGMPSLERITLWSCSGVTNAGVAALAALPHLRELTLESLPRVTRDVLPMFPQRIHVSYAT